ncbi:MAG: FAD-dependent monooxygenase, partial [Actinomycetota bacterium]|nr:FAD-dependent monooxygenase [Actinomycetota bacterium]
TEVLTFEMPRSAHDVFPPMVNISQSRAEQILVDAIETTPGADVHWRSRVVGCEPRGDSVRLDVETPDGVVGLDADWVVAADGARSVVRDLLGLRLHGTSYEGRYVIADIHWPSTLPAERKVWFDPPSAPGTTLILHRQPDDIWRVDYQLDPDEDAELEVQEDRIRRRIGRHLAWLGDDTPWTLEWASIYRAHALSLDGYRHGRVLFAGDAAHLVPIFGVRGLNSGLEDADSLAWMLALVHRGAADDSLLDVWAAERRNAWEQNIAQADLSTRFMTPGTRGYHLTRDAVLALTPQHPELRALINPRQSSATHARCSPLSAPSSPAAGPCAGDPVADVPVEPTRVRETGADTLLRLAAGRFVVLGFGVPVDERTRVAEAVRARFGCPDVADVDGAVLDAGAVAHVLGDLARETLVIRPDGLVLARLIPGEPLAGAPFSASGEARPPAAPPGSRPAASGPERVWTLLSEAIDVMPAQNREQHLTRLLMSLAITQCTPEQVRKATASTTTL